MRGVNEHARKFDFLEDATDVDPFLESLDARQRGAGDVYLSRAIAHRYGLIIFFSYSTNFLHGCRYHNNTRG
jgi:hypothetical protein